MVKACKKECINNIQIPKKVDRPGLLSVEPGWHCDWKSLRGRGEWARCRRVSRQEGGSWQVGNPKTRSKRVQREQVQSTSITKAGMSNYHCADEKARMSLKLIFSPKTREFTRSTICRVHTISVETLCEGRGLSP